MVRQRPVRRLGLLAVVLAVALTAGCGDDEDASTEAGTEGGTGTTTSTSPAEVEGGEGADGAAPPADQQVTERTGFSAPSAGVSCSIDRERVRCRVSERDWEAPDAPPGCGPDYGSRIELSAGAAPRFLCGGRTELGAGPELASGRSIGSGLLRCESSDAGVTCRDAESGRGFTIGERAYELF